MDQEAFGNYLKDRYQDQIEWYDRKASENQTKYRWMQWMVIILAALTPVFIELDFLRSSETFEHLPTVTSAIVAILSAGLKTFKYQENWLNYRTTCETLRKEKHFYNANLGDYARARDKEALFIERVETMISRENTMWISTQKTERASEEEASKQ